MVNKKKQNFFLTLPKKELVTLCRKYGIPSHKRKPDLAEALAALLPEHYELKGLNRKCADTSCSRSVERDHSSLDLNALPRRSGRKHLSIPGYGRRVDVRSAGFPGKNAFVESVRSVEVSSPSFEFHVRSEEGINLYVDLNSTLADWAESLKRNICLTESSSYNKSQRFHEDIGRLGGSSSHLKGFPPVAENVVNVNHLPSGAARHSENKANSCKDFDCLDRIEGSLMSSVNISHTKNEGLSKPIEENEALILPISSSCVLDEVPASATSEDPKLDCVGDSVSNSISDGAISFLTSEQSLKVITEECGSSIVRYICNPSYTDSTVHGCSTFASLEKQLSGDASFQKDKAAPCKTNGTGLPDDICNMESEQGESANSSEVDHGADRNQFLICSAKEEPSSTTSGMEISRCSQFEKSYARNSLVTDDLDSSGNFPKTQSNAGVEGDSLIKPDSRNLRRLNHLAGEKFPRRSMRLVSKVLKLLAGKFGAMEEVISPSSVRPYDRQMILERTRKQDQ